MKIQDITEGYGRYYCSTDKKWKTRKGPKQSRKVAEGSSTMWEVSFDYGPHMSDTVKVKASSEDEAIAKVEKAAEKRGRSIDINWAKPAEPGVAEGRVDQIAPGGADYSKHSTDELKAMLRPGVMGRNELKFKTLIRQELRKREQQGVAEEKTRLDPKCWDGYKKDGTKMKGDTRVNNCVKEELEETYDGDEFFEAYGELWFNEDEQLDEADYQGRSVPLGKPMQGDVKKFKVYVKDPGTGNVKKVNFGDPDMKIRKSNPAARRSFRARHNCDNPGPRTKARYWSCRKW